MKREERNRSKMRKNQVLLSVSGENSPAQDCPIVF